MPSPDTALPESRRGAVADGHWRIEVLGGLRASSGDWVVSHFPGRPVAALLARLAIFPRSGHSREELIELLWPGVTVEIGRNRLRQVLSTLRNLLEPPGSPAVVIADRNTVRLRPDAVACDAVEFERALRARRDHEARALYRGELLPGFHDEWVVDERRRLQALREQLTERDDALSASPAGPAPPAQQAIDAAMLCLPAYLSSFVGRDADLRACADAVRQHRLVTLAGPGGCGKTRLATEVAKQVGGFDPVIFVGLADCRDGAQLADRVRVAARLPGATGAAIDTLAGRLAERRALLVLDNFEQLVSAGGSEALLTLLAALPLAHALVTSRRVLRVPGEQERLLAPLPLPAADDDLAGAARNPSVALFIDRARSVRGDFGLTARNREDLLVVCRMLEGLPLALEIAATRVRTYSLAGMRVELVRRFPVLIRGGTAAPRDPRHASLRAAIDWSWQLLTPRVRDFLGAMTVFRGGWSVSEAAAVAAAADTHELLDALVGDSLLTVSREGVDDEPHEPCFQMLEAVREFVVEHIEAATATSLRRAHREHFLDLARALAERRQLVAEAALGNFVEALQTALDDAEPALALALFVALKLQWESVGTPPDVLALMQRAAQTVPPGTERLALFLSMLARLLLLAGQSAQALDCATRALAAAGDDTGARAEAMFAHTRVDWVWKREGARVIGPARDGLRLAQQAGARETEASALSLVGAITLWGLDQPLQALPIYEAAERLYLELGNPRGALQAAHGRMGCLYATGRYDEAILMGEALAQRSQALGNIEAQIVALNLLTACHAKRRRFAQALATCQQETRLAQRHHKVYNLVNSLWSQGHFQARLRRPRVAAVLQAFAERYWIDHLGPLPVQEGRHMAKVRRLVRAQVGAAQCDAWWAEGSALTAGEAIRLGSGA